MTIDQQDVMKYLGLKSLYDKCDETDDRDDETRFHDNLREVDRVLKFCSHLSRGECTTARYLAREWDWSMETEMFTLRFWYKNAN